MYRYLHTLQCPEGMDVEQRTVFVHQARPYELKSGVLLKRGTDDELRRCLKANEVPRVVEAMHSEPTGGHYALQNTVKKILDVGYW